MRKKSSKIFFVVLLLLSVSICGYIIIRGSHKQEGIPVHYFSYVGMTQEEYAKHAGISLNAANYKSIPDIIDLFGMNREAVFTKYQFPTGIFLDKTEKLLGRDAVVALKYERFADVISGFTYYFYMEEPKETDYAYFERLYKYIENQYGEPSQNSNRVRAISNWQKSLSDGLAEPGDWLEDRWVLPLKIADFSSVEPFVVTPAAGQVGTITWPYEYGGLEIRMKKLLDESLVVDLTFRALDSKESKWWEWRNPD